MGSKYHVFNFVPIRKSLTVNKKKILITGSCGFIFSNFVRKVIYESNQKDSKYQPYDVISIDRVNYNATNNLYWSRDHTFYIADIRDQHVIDTIIKFEQPNIIIHGAAETLVNSPLCEPNSFITTNVLGTQVIINACLKYKVDKLIYISDEEVLGPSDNPLDELSTINPHTPYAASKAAGELLVMAAHKSHGLIYNIIRLSNNYGRRQSLENLVPKTIKCIQDEQPIVLQGMDTRVWTHVFDTCTGILNILDLNKNNEIYHLSSEHEFTNLEVVQTICNVMEKGYNSIIFEEHKLNNFKYSINSNKIKELGWKTNYKFKNGIINTVDYYLNNQWFFK